MLLATPSANQRENSSPKLLNENSPSRMPRPENTIAVPANEKATG